MKFSLYCCIILFLSACIKQQAVSDDYMKDYYPLINKTESLIVQKNIREALNNYSIAFRNVKHAQNKDLLNASVCALKIKNEKIALQYIVSLFERGMEYELIKQMVSFQEASINFQKQVKIKYDNISNTKAYCYNPVTRNFCIDLFNLDQFYRNKENYRSYPNLKWKIDSIDKVVVQRFLNYVQTEGFPSDYDIGVGSIFYVPIYSVIFVHAFSPQNPHNELIREKLTLCLLKAIKEGKINPYTGFNLLPSTNYAFNPQVGIPVFLKLAGDKELYYAPLFKDDSLKIERTRKNWGLSTLAQSREKMYYAGQQWWLDFSLECGKCIPQLNVDQQFAREFKSRSHVYTPE